MNKKTKKIVGIATTGALVLSLGTGAMFLSNTTVSAAVDEDTQTITQRFAGMVRGERPEGMEAGERLEGMTRGDKSEKMEAMGIDEGTQKGQRPEGMENREQKGNKSLDFDLLVEEDLLTEDQVLEIEALTEGLKADRQAQRELVQAMTEDERLAYREERSIEEKTGLFDTLIDEGIVDASEAEAIESYLQEEKSAERASLITSKLEGLVTDGTLSVEDVDAVIAYLDDQEPRQRVAKEDRVEGLDEERVSPFDEMVSESIISDTQAEAIETLMKSAGKGRK